MDPEDSLCSSEVWTKSSSFSNISTQQPAQKWVDTSILDYAMDQPFQEFDEPTESKTSLTCNPTQQIDIPDKDSDQINAALLASKIQDWDPRVMLNNLSFLEQKIHQLQELVHLIVGRRSQALARPDELVVQQQQLITADLTSIIVQLISTAGSLLPSVKHNLSAAVPPVGQLEQLDRVLFASGAGSSGVVQSQHDDGTKFPELPTQIDESSKCGKEQNMTMEEHELKDEEDVDESENLPPGSYEILQLEKEEILAPHTHFCAICGKGFKRDANLRMHMRGHGDEYKTAAALAKPNKEPSTETVLIKRYSCPFTGCKRNKDHKKFQPLKTILCVKNHYKRTHCDKSFTCSKCNSKKFSVIADLKTHEKHCGKDKWLCSCGTTFSRKDKLFGHIALFQGHTPAIPLDESKGTVGPCDRGERYEAMNKHGSINFSFGSGGSSVENIADAKGVDDPLGYFSPLNFDSCNFGGFHEFPRPPFENTENAFSFLIPASSNYNQKSGAESSSNNLE
ncbi:protein SENSITIVE TO PROTON RHIZOTOXICITY 1 [Momordica charantia]|uniref:Protein SENSITIVE TO PROTON RHIZOTOXICITY 1 n=1 Tax=Momordica charantia TaxID=3673 RepID=A0A6J1C1G4_MOMCH|nr:protein SENSITIVE TO PROTON RHIZOTOXICITY 1 [Momordica charantia]